MLAEMNLAWTEVDPQRVVRSVETQYVFLMLRSGDDESVEAKVIWASDLGGAQNEARRYLAMDPTLRQVSILDAKARQVLAIVRAEMRAARALPRGTTLSTKRNWSRPAYH